MEANIQEEIWKDIIGFEGYYQVSNFGRVKSLPRKVNSPIRNNKTIIRKERILKLGTLPLGYKQIRLQVGNLDETIRVHRLVAKHFIDNPKLFPIINHIDANPSNNHFKNLEWCTQSHNIKYAYDIGRKKTSPAFLIPKIGIDSPLSRSVNQFSLDGNFIKKWGFVSEIERTLGFSRPNICKCCRGKIKTAYGFKWEYA